MDSGLQNQRKSDFVARWDQGDKYHSGQRERARFDKYRVRERDEFVPPKSVSVRRGSQLYEEQQLALVNARLESQNKAPDALEGPKYEESISDKRQRLRSAARRAVMEHVKQWKQQQSMQNEAREESNMDEEERMKKRTELLRELHKQQDELLSSARDPLTAQAYARENATTGDDGSIRAEDRRQKRYASQWSVRGSGVNQQWNLMERSLHPRSDEQEAKLGGASLDREKSEEKKDTSFDRDSVPEGKAQQQHGAGQEAQQKTGKIGA